ncbi:DUF1803 domain-containing protein [Lactococcus protaetiae]|uniref:DUF1803 domain-containing protein n=1 Tax=Lactococcus protaetiae TaxID=2592653 RepID=A0A514ZB13_9LACT|nr:DUF1803 domain-containing protein [Lactococcus protaetiae]QDK71770.1 DUF1803 domain-containing protein [Lactococcus protaetiae]
MIKIYNENRMTRRPFFKALIEYLAHHEETTLRQIHKDFTDVKNLDRQLDTFIDAGLIVRADKRYYLGFHVFSDKDFTDRNLSVLKETLSVRNVFTAPFFVESDSEIATKLELSWQIQTLSNRTNKVKLNFASRYNLQTATLANYFYKVAEQLSLTDFEKEIYQIMGDVDLEYALKYMTTFLLKFMRKDVVKTKEDIFVQVLEKFEMIEKVGEREYRCLLNFVEYEISEIVFDDAESFIEAQIQQKTPIENFISLGD